MIYKNLKTTAFLAFIIFFVCNLQYAKGQVIWDFEKATPLVDNSKFINLKLISRMNAPELVKGITGTGIRTDGYSTWLSAKLPETLNNVAQISGYFALETYPTDTAGFFTLYNSQKKAWISGCIDRFGKALVGVCENGNIAYYPTEAKLPKFKWMNICLKIAGPEVQFLVNGQFVASIILKDSSFNSGIDSLNIGRDGRNKHIGIFPLNLINGIIDHVELSGNVLQSKGWDRGLANYIKQTPKLEVPNSRFAGDFSRPLYHLLPAANWTNETHGLIYYQGLYHIFNQKNGANLFLGQINWGHFTSPDLVHWTEHRPVLTPEPGYDQNGIWSGCSFLDDSGKPVIVYSSADDTSFDICMARPADNALNNWVKFKGNPIIKSSPAAYSRKDFHDPYVWKGRGCWYMIVGFGLTKIGTEKGTVLLYKSYDLENWKFIHPLFIGDPVNDDSGVFWEMPVFWEMNGKYILLVNKVPHNGKPAVALYWTGKFVNEQFVPDNKMPKNLEVINRLLSPSVTHDAAGRTVAIAIIPDETSAKATFQAGWTHLYSIPRIWTLKHDTICQQPHPALKQLRGKVQQFKSQVIHAGNNLLLISGKHQVEILVDLIPGQCKNFGFVIGKNPDGSEFTRIYYDFDRKQLIVDQTRSSLKKYIPLQIRTGNYSLGDNQKVNIHLFIDGSVVEGFINNKDAFTTRLFPKSKDSNQVEIFTEGGETQLLKAEVWDLNGSNNKTDF